MFPRSIKNPVPDVVEDARPLVKDAERFEEEKEREDAEKRMGEEIPAEIRHLATPGGRPPREGEKHVFWPEED